MLLLILVSCGTDGPQPGTAIPELSLETPGVPRRFPAKPSGTGLAAGGCCRGQTLALNSRGNVPQYRPDEETNDFSYREQKGQEKGSRNGCSPAKSAVTEQKGIHCGDCGLRFQKLRDGAGE